MLTAAGRNAPAPWVPCTRAGCNFGTVGSANTELEGLGYWFTDANGRVSTKKELLDDMKAGKIKIESQDISDVKVHRYGNTAVETGRLVSKGTRDGKDTSGTFRCTRVWLNRNGTWQTVAFQETKIP